MKKLGNLNRLQIYWARSVSSLTKDDNSNMIHNSHHLQHVLDYFSTRYRLLTSKPQLMKKKIEGKMIEERQEEWGKTSKNLKMIQTYISEHYTHSFGLMQASNSFHSSLPSSGFCTANNKIALNYEFKTSRCSIFK